LKGTVDDMVGGGRKKQPVQPLSSSRRSQTED